MAKGLGNSMRKALFFGVILAWVTFIYSCSPAPTDTGANKIDDSPQFDETNPLGANAACYVCHMTFVREALSKTHLKAEVGCIECHGISSGHANDEDIGATPPDISFEREQVDTMCRNCHGSHDVPAAQVIARWLEQHPAKSPVACTDCHGTHRIDRFGGEEESSAQETEYKKVHKQSIDVLRRLDYFVDVEL